MSATQLASSVLLKVQKYFEGKLNIFLVWTLPSCSQQLNCWSWRRRDWTC